MAGTKVVFEFSVYDYFMGCEIETKEPPTLTNGDFALPTPVWVDWGE